MIDTVEAYRLIMVCNLHFNTEKFDCTKTASIKNINKRFELLSHKEQIQIRHLAGAFDSKQEFCKMLIACYMDEKDPRYTVRATAVECYKKYIARKESLSYRLELDHATHKDYLNDWHTILNSVICGSCMPEYIVLIDKLYPFLDDIYDKVEFIGYKSLILKLRKFRSFFNPEKYYAIVKE